MFLVICFMKKPQALQSLCRLLLVLELQQGASAIISLTCKKSIASRSIQSLSTISRPSRANVPQVKSLSRHILDPYWGFCYNPPTKGLGPHPTHSHDPTGQAEHVPLPGPPAAGPRQHTQHRAALGRL